MAARMLLMRALAAILVGAGATTYKDAPLQLPSRFFDAGMLHMAGFNRDEALKCFAAAAALDARCAACRWGLAYACDPTAGDKCSLDAGCASNEAAAALQLPARGGREPACTAVEQGLVRAFEVRFPAAAAGKEAGEDLGA